MHLQMKKKGITIWTRLQNWKSCVFFGIEKVHLDLWIKICIPLYSWWFEFFGRLEMETGWKKWNKRTHNNMSNAYYIRWNRKMNARVQCRIERVPMNQNEKKSAIRIFFFAKRAQCRRQSQINWKLYKSNKRMLKKSVTLLVVADVVDFFYFIS